MEESLRNRIILILAVLSVILFIGAVSSCGSAYRQKVSRDREMAMRLDLEEKINKIAAEKTLLEEKLSAKEQELEEEKTAHEASKKALVQEQLVNQSLKDELQKVIKLKEALESDLKEALVNKTKK